MSRPFHVDERDWSPLRGLAVSAAGFKRLAESDYTGGAFDIELTRIGPGGASTPHTEPWSHLFYVLEGEGALEIEGERSALKPGSVAPVRAGETHHLANTGSGDLVMLVLYHPARTRGP
jgi:quercetin dioxygenase-like cupin family protein